MKLYVCAILLCVLSACSTSSGSQKGVGFTGLGGDAMNRNQQSVSSLPQRPATANPLPFIEENSRGYMRGRPALDQRNAAFKAFRARENFFLGAKTELVQIGKFRLKMREAKVDTHYFIVAENASNMWGARKFNLATKTRELAATRTTCTLTGEVYAIRDGYSAGMILPMKC